MLCQSPLPTYAYVQGSHTFVKGMLTRKLHAGGGGVHVHC